MRRIICLLAIVVCVDTASAATPAPGEGYFVVYAALLYKLTGERAYGDEARLVILRWARDPTTAATRGLIGFAAAYASTFERFSDREQLDVEVWLRRMGAEVRAKHPAAMIAACPAFAAAIGEDALAALTLDDLRHVVDRSISRASAPR